MKKAIITATTLLISLANNLNAQSMQQTANENYRSWYNDEKPKYDGTDPELATIFKNFAFGEIQKNVQLDTRTKIILTMASTITQNTPTAYRELLGAALKNGITPEEIKEVLYHCTPYIGMPKVEENLNIANAFFNDNNISLPLRSQNIIDQKDRLEKGLAFQKSIFGEQIDKLYKNAPKEQLHIQQLLSANCFGDYQTRPIFDVRMRELITFTILVSLGGAEQQVKGHVQGNVNVGNNKSILLSVVTQLIPYIGYPRTLNALQCINEIIPEKQ